MKQYRALLLGDVIGEDGIKYLLSVLPSLVDHYRPDLICLNAENASGGFGLTALDAKTLLDAGIDCLTSGNHIWEKKGIAELLEAEPRLLRPHNYPAGAPGRGVYCLEKAGAQWAVLNLQGREGMTPLDSPFAVADRLLADLPADSLKVLDFHAESFEEKEALGLYLDGRVSVVAGTHTHIATADERILPQGTGYLGDLGMCGPLDSVIGSYTTLCLQRCLTQMPIKLEPAHGDCRLSGALFVIGQDGRCQAIERISYWQPDPASFA